MVFVTLAIVVVALVAAAEVIEPALAVALRPRRPSGLERYCD